MARLQTQQTNKAVFVINSRGSHTRTHTNYQIQTFHETQRNVYYQQYLQKDKAGN